MQHYKNIQKNIQRKRFKKQQKIYHFKYFNTNHTPRSHFLRNRHYAWI